ncbi:MAG: sulfatase-like hydrolase/transferase [Sphingomonas sp.]|nr:sulfatase-like hydrolase/transferase [Sphingomonas sp.]
MRFDTIFPRASAAARSAWTRAARLTLPATILVTLIVELALAERKYGLFGGGFGQSRALDAPLETGAFLAALLACQILLFVLLYRLVRRLHGRQGDSPLFHFNFAFWIGGGAIGLTVAKFQALAYFSDAMSLQIVRNLGGGSLVDALLYTLSEAGLIAIAALGAACLYALGWWALRRRWRGAPPLPDHYRFGWRGGIAAFLAVALLLFAANRVDDARSALSRFNAVQLFGAILHEATDFDRDGWSLYSHPIDRQPFDSARHPYALDIPNNGIDEDGLGGDFTFSGGLPAERAPVIAGRKRNVILIVLESTRADALGKRIDGIAVAPNLEALARTGSAAPAAYSHVGFTTQSLHSLFTGELAPADGRHSLVNAFLANGYRVGVLSGQAEDFGGTAERVGMRRGDLFVDATTHREERASVFAAQGSLTIDGRVLLREFDVRLGERRAWDRPWFLYVNLQSAHFPYAWPGMDRILPGEPLPRREIDAANRDRLERTYWNAVAYNDRLIGELIERLRGLGVLEDTLIVVTADHGESLFDDGFLGHGHTLNDEQTRIPFVLSDPGIRFAGPIGLADMRAILLRAAGAVVAAPANDGVFQYLGTLDRPGAIGLVEPDGRRVVYDLYREAVQGSDGRWTPYAELPPQSALRASADDVIDRWARERWLAHLRANR